MQADFDARVRTLVDAYIVALDRRRFDDWLGLFAEDGYYAALRRVEHEKGSNVLLVGEDVKRLGARIDSGRERDLRRTVHTVAWVSVDESALRGTAAFALWMDGAPTYAGTYEFDFVDTDAKLRISKCTAVIDNKTVTDPIYMPI